MTITDQMLETMEILGRLHEESRSPEEKERLLLAFGAIKYIWNIGNRWDFAEYHDSLSANGPPLVIATFNTREEADAWFNSQTEPPDDAHILIAGEYFLTYYNPSNGIRHLRRSITLKWYLAYMIQDGIPAPVATFDTREKAQSWLDSQPQPPRQVFIHIAGEAYLVVYHYKVKLRAMYPVSMAAKPPHSGKVEY